MSEGIIKFIDKLCKVSSEREWLEFKSEKDTPERIGEYISALSNSACLHEAEEAYLVFGVENENHKIVGTSFDSRVEKGKGNEDLEPWLHRHLKPATEFNIKTVSHPKGRVVIFFIQPAVFGPVKFMDKSWIRVDSSKKSLNEFPEKEAIIWDRRRFFEDAIAREKISEVEVQKLLDCNQYFRLIGQSPVTNSEEIIENFLHEGFLIKKGGKIHISNLGAIVLGRDLRNFYKLKNKAVRIITYNGKNKLNSVKDITIVGGYAVVFKKLVSYIESQIPRYEKILDPKKIIRAGYPIEAIREFIANALIHQDFYITGTSPVIEIFDDRMEIYNPGNSLIRSDRFIDKAPKSRNEKLADILRRMKICEKRGAGVDRAILNIELKKLPAPKIEAQKDSVRVTMYAKKELGKLTEEEKCRACYFHSCIKHVVDQEPMTNKTLCQRLGIDSKNKTIASRIIKATLEKKLIKPFDPENKSSRYAKYIPYWVAVSSL